MWMDADLAHAPQAPSPCRALPSPHRARGSRSHLRRLPTPIVPLPRPRTHRLQRCQLLNTLHRLRHRQVLKILHRVLLAVPPRHALCWAPLSPCSAKRHRQRRGQPSPSDLSLTTKFSPPPATGCSRSSSPNFSSSSHTALLSPVHVAPMWPSWKLE
jgi:hypothetical protein